MLITAELAQKIVDNIMPLVRQNINIMNHAGIIIGSGQANRLNTLHQGALEVIRSGDVIEILPEHIERYPGAQPGLNWPIILNEQIVGVVGISGHPDIVRDTAKLVKMVTELLLERENLVEEFRSNLQLREQFVRLILTANYEDNYEQIAQIANLLRLPLDCHRLMAVINIAPILEEARRQYGAYDLVTSRIEENLAEQLEAAELIDNRYDLYVFSNRELIILKHFPVNSSYEEFYLWGGKVVAALNEKQLYGRLRMGIGSLAASSKELRYSYQEAVYCQNTSLNAATASIYDFDLLAAYLLGMPEAMETCLALRQLKEKIYRSLCVRYDMENTMNSLLHNNLNVSTAAKELFIHRNTMVFRLEKLKELTGLSPSKFLNHAILCKIIFSGKFQGNSTSARLRSLGTE